MSIGEGIPGPPHAPGYLFDDFGFTHALSLVLQRALRVGDIPTMATTPKVATRAMASDHLGLRR